jgi:hypothetical protein
MFRVADQAGFIGLSFLFDWLAQSDEAALHKSSLSNLRNLSSENKCGLYVSEVMECGFLVISDVTVFLTKTTSYYLQSYKSYTSWGDLEIGIAWSSGVKNPG